MTACYPHFTVCPDVGIAMPVKTIPLAMIGGGEGAFIGAIHRAAAAIDGRFALVAGAFSSDADRSRQSAIAIGIDADRGYGSANEMLAAEAARTDGARAVVITTPNYCHRDQIIAAAKHGFAIFAEKPLTLTMPDAMAISKSIADSRVPFVLAHGYSGYPMVAQARALVQAGALGAIRRVDAAYLQGWLAEPIERNGQKQAAWRTDPQKAGSGASGDIATHAHHLLEHVTGLRVNRVSARLASLVQGRKIDDDASLLAELSNGAVGTVSVSQVAVGRANGLTLCIYGDKAGLEWCQEEPDSLWLRPHGAPEQRWTAGSDRIYLDDHVRRLCRTPSGHPMGFIEAFGNLYRAFADQIEQHPVIDYSPGIEEGLRGMAFLEAVQASSGNGGQWTGLAL
jgi:predicted dehydrogenase